VEETHVVALSSVLACTTEFAIRWPVYAKQPTPVAAVYLIDYIYNKQFGFRTVEHIDPIRGELEVRQFGRDYLRSLVDTYTVSLPIFVFADEFGLFRRKNNNITSVYFIPAGLCFEERQKGPSAYTIVLGPYSSQLDNTLRVFHSCLAALGRGCSIDINREVYTVLALILAVVGDMKG
jgi:hypothetical protein